MKKFLALTSLAFAWSLTAHAGAEWKIKKAYWSQQDEENFQEFVFKIGEARASGKCNTFASCLKGSWNTYRGTDPAGFTPYSDCADLPAMLRIYFAWKNNLPFGYINGVRATDPESAPKIPNTNPPIPDIRYSSGNYVTSRVSLTTPASGFRSGPREMTNASNVISSMMFRLHPKPTMESTPLFDDFYSPVLSRDGIKPGTAIYDPAGHVAVVWKVGNDGRVFFIDAHPDNSLTHGVYGEKFSRSRPSAGAGFRNWRPIVLEGYKTDAQGNLRGGRIVGMSNKKLVELKAYSTTQYFGNANVDANNWRKGKFVWNGQTVGYYDYVRNALAVGELKFHPVEEVKNMMAGLCQDLQDRAVSVDAAIKAGIHKKAHPPRLPSNIYGTAGEWEDYSTPSRDARLKTSFLELRTRVEEFVEKHRQGDRSIEYEGTDLKGDLKAAYEEAATACKVVYKTSTGAAKTLGFEEVRKRLYDLSFDPYHCVELRWGAKGDELASCPDDATKRHWYDAEKYLRNQIERRYDAKMDYTADELLRLPTNVGVREAPDVDVLEYLARP